VFRHGWSDGGVKAEAGVSLSTRNHRWYKEDDEYEFGVPQPLRAWYKVGPGGDVTVPYKMAVAVTTTRGHVLRQKNMRYCYIKNMFEM
jgi:hypothetical protein